MQYDTNRIYINKLTHIEAQKILKNCKNNDIYKYALKKDHKNKDLENEYLFNYASYNVETKDFIGYANGYHPIPNNTLWIQTFIINNKFLRQGYGTEFYQAIIQRLSTYEPINQIYLSCYKDNIQGLEFWESLDFTITAEKSKLLPKTSIPSTFYIYHKNLF